MTDETRRLTTRKAENLIDDEGVFLGHEGLRGLAASNEFWEKQDYGTRLYYGDGTFDYLHRSVLQAAIAALDKAALRSEGREHVSVPREPTDELACFLAQCHLSKLTAQKREWAYARWTLLLDKAAAPPAPNRDAELLRECRNAIVDAQNKGGISAVTPWLASVRIAIDAALAAAPDEDDISMPFSDSMERKV